MSKGPHHPGGQRGRRRRRHGRPGGHNARPGQPGNNQGRPRRGATFTGPMDHSYRLNQGDVQGNGFGPPRGGPRGFPQVPQGFFQAPEIEPLPAGQDDVTRIFAFVEDLFFQTKIQDTARKLNVKVEFPKSDKDILDRLEQNEEARPSLIIFDLNNLNAKPLTAIPKLRARLKKQTSIVGFLSHVQGDLKLKAQEAGCDAVMPRSAFSQNLPQLLRRHGASPELDEVN